MITATRIGDSPIIHPGLSPGIGDNINGPSLVRRPDWAPGPGRYLLYFAHHYGRHIRLAYADNIAGPWSIHEPGVLPLKETPFAQTPPDLPQPDWAIEHGMDANTPHLASPDVHILEDRQRFEMLVHGLCDDGEQRSYLAVSDDGLTWQIGGPAIDQSYIRRFEHDGAIYGIGLTGQAMRGLPDGGYELDPTPLPGRIRHVGLLKRDATLHVFYSCYGDAPERLFHVMLDVSGGWLNWSTVSQPQEILRPEMEWEGAKLAIEPSIIGATPFTHALRDPAFLEENGRVYMVYAGGGEAALGLAEITGLSVGQA